MPTERSEFSLRPLFAGVLVATLFFLLVWSMTLGDQVARLRVLAAAPRATVAAPRTGLAVYTGRLVGPAGRQSPTGVSAAAFAWRLTRREGKNTRTVCSARALQGLSLRDDAGHLLRLSLFEDRRDATLLRANASQGLNDPLTVELRPQRGAAPPALEGNCPLLDATYGEEGLPEDAQVTVVGCYDSGALHPCEGALHGLLTPSPLEAHRARLLNDALEDTSLVLGVALVSLLGAALFLFTRRAQVLAVRVASQRSEA